MEKLTFLPRDTVEYDSWSSYLYNKCSDLEHSFMYQIEADPT